MYVYTVTNFYVKPWIASGQFGSLQWSNHESHILYVAERKKTTAKSYFDKKAAQEIESGKTDIVRVSNSTFL